MVDGLTFVLLGVIIGTFIPFIAGWVTFDRSLHELVAEAQALRQETASLRKLATSLAGELERLARAEMPTGRDLALSNLLEVASFADSVSSLAIEREPADMMVRHA